MATFDQLSAEQRAIIELVLRQGKSYAELAEMLDLPEDRVRELAHESLEQLAPVTAAAVEDDWRGQLVDYVLGQQSGTEVTATRGHLRRSEAARAWTRSLLDSLDFLYPDGLPEVPESRGGRRRDGAAPRERANGPLSPEAHAAVQRRRMLAGAGIVALLLIVVLVWPVGLLTGGDDESSGDGGSEQTSAQAAKNQAAGVAVVALKDGKYSVLVTAAKLPALKRDQAYEVWLYNSQGDAKSLGAQVPAENGELLRPERRADALGGREVPLRRHLARAGRQRDRAFGHVGPARAACSRSATPAPSRARRRRSATRCFVHRAADRSPPSR